MIYDLENIEKTKKSTIKEDCIYNLCREQILINIIVNINKMQIKYLNLIQIPIASCNKEELNCLVCYTKVKLRYS